MPKKSAIIFDLDGTLADCEHRRHFVTGEKKDWESFYAGMANDPVNPLVLAMLKSFAEAQTALIIFVTGRPEKYRMITNDWITRVSGFLCGHLFMRPDGDSTPDDQFKERIYKEQIQPYYDVKLVIDDREKVVKMWRRNDLECWQVAAGNF